MKAKSLSKGMRGAIDPHTHICPPLFIEDVRRGRFGRKVVIEQNSGSEWIVARSKMIGKDLEVRMKLDPGRYKLEPRLKDMERMGVDRQIPSINPQFALYTLDTEATKDLAVSINDGLSALAREYPEKFSGMATVPLQDPYAAADELERAKKAGHIGVMINSNVAGMNLSDPSLDVFWAKVTDLDLPVFIHPTNVCGEADRLKEFYLGNFIGNPLDTTISVACTRTRSSHSFRKTWRQASPSSSVSAWIRTAFASAASTSARLRMAVPVTCAREIAALTSDEPSSAT